MPLEMRTQRDGSLRPNWYGRYEINGRLVRPNLFIKIAGTPPASRSLRDEGDGAFERSRATAQAKLDGIVEEARTKQGSVRLVEKLYEIKTGEAIRSILLANLPEEWAKIARKRKPNARYASQCQSTLKRFAEFVHQENVKTVEIAHVTRTAARSFMDAESSRGVTAKTWNDILKLLRATFKYLLPAGAINPFSDLPTRETETIFRKPYSPEELAAIVDAARTDEFIRPLLVTGICTAMRRGDCCLLQWSDVDLQRRFITVKTAKTGQTVSIPIFPMLYDEFKLATRNQKSNDGFVFPEQARMYQENPDGITWRVKKVLAAAGFRDEERIVAYRQQVAACSQTWQREHLSWRDSCGTQGRIAAGERAGFSQLSRNLGDAGANRRSTAGTGAKGYGTQDNRHRVETLFSAWTRGVQVGIAVSHA